MMSSSVEVVCDACGATAHVRADVHNSYGIIARPVGWTHGGRGMAVIGAKDYCPTCSPLLGGTSWQETLSSFPPAAPDEMLAVLVLDDSSV
jgi:hypothetical protein